MIKIYKYSSLFTVNLKLHLLYKLSVKLMLKCVCLWYFQSSNLIYFGGKLKRVPSSVRFSDESTDETVLYYSKKQLELGNLFR